MARFDLLAATSLFLFSTFLQTQQANSSLKIEKELHVILDTEDVKASPYYKDKVLSIPISQEAGKELMQHWTDQAFSGLISAIATRRLHLVEKHDQKKHEDCASSALNVTKHAQCLVELEKDGTRNMLLKRKKFFDRKTRKKLMKENRSTSDERKVLRKRKRVLKNESQEKWVGSFKYARTKREIKVKNRASYDLKSENDRTPFGIITKHLSNTVKILKNKDKLSKWQTIVKRIKEESILMKNRKTAENIAEKRMKVFQKGAKHLKYGDESEEYQMENQRKPLIDPEMKKYAEVEKYIEDEETRELFHNKLTNMTEEEKVMMVPVDIIRELAKIGLNLSGKNTTDFNKKTVKLISPKFMSVIPDDESVKDNELDFLSPSLFSLHDEGTGIEKSASLKSLLGGAMDSTDSQLFMDFLVEATGVAEAVEDAEFKLIDAQRKKDDAMGRGPDGQPLYFTKENVTKRYPSEAEKIELMEKIDKTYTLEQLKDMNQTGYTILTPKQMEMMYGEKSPFKNPRLLRTYKNMTIAEIHRAIHATMKDVADEKLKFEVRQKDIVSTPIVASAIINDPATASQALILSPAVFVPIIQSPAIFGTVILSPWLFVPLILSPRILGPVVLDPFAFVPIILSPLALVPVVLSPGVMNPFVLSPLVLCPFILSPQVMTPLILSPFALTPLLGTPLALSPLVLSPFVLSPQILSPQFVTAFILSPYALSPAVESNGALVTVVASPSWLS